MYVWPTIGRLVQGFLLPVSQAPALTCPLLTARLCAWYVVRPSACVLWGGDAARRFQIGDSAKVTDATCKDNFVGRSSDRPPFNATLTIHVGDISYSGPNSGGNATLGAMLWDVFLAEMECLAGRMPYMTAAGNHDVCPPAVSVDGYVNWCGGDSGWECGSEYLARYKMPQSNYTMPAGGFNPSSSTDCMSTYTSVDAK